MEKEYTMYRELTKKPYVAPSLTVVDFRVEQGFVNSPEPPLPNIGIEDRQLNGTWESEGATPQDGWIY